MDAVQFFGKFIFLCPILTLTLISPADRERAAEGVWLALQ